MRRNQITEHKTIALQADSPAINAGDESVCAAMPVSNLDQRGLVRPGLDATSCSIGAFEYNGGPAPTATVTPTPTITSSATPSPTRMPSLTPTSSPVPSLTPTPSPVPSLTPASSPLPSLTPTASPLPSQTPAPSATIPIEPTPTATLPACTGDCNGDRSVDVGELVLMVNVALGNQPIFTCAAGDADHSGTIDIAEIVTAVGHALAQCPEVSRSYSPPANPALPCEEPMTPIGGALT